MFLSVSVFRVINVPKLIVLVKTHYVILKLQIVQAFIIATICEEWWQKVQTITIICLNLFVYKASHEYK